MPNEPIQSTMSTAAHQVHSTAKRRLPRTRSRFDAKACKKIENAVDRFEQLAKSSDPDSRQLIDDLIDDFGFLEHYSSSAASPTPQSRSLSAPNKNVRQENKLSPFVALPKSNPQLKQSGSYAPLWQQEISNTVKDRKERRIGYSRIESRLAIMETLKKQFPSVPEVDLRTHLDKEVNAQGGTTNQGLVNVKRKRKGASSS